MSTTTPAAPWISLESMRDYLRIDPNDTSDDDQLERKIASACGVVETIKGRIGPVEIVGEIQDVGMRGNVFLDEHPVLEVVEVATYRGATKVVIPPADPTAGRAGGWQLVSAGGVLVIPRWGAGALGAGSQVAVTYRAGLDPIPANYLDAATELAAHLFDSSQNNTGGGRMGGDDEPEIVRGTPYALPIHVRELLGIYGPVARSQVLVR